MTRMRRSRFALAVPGSILLSLVLASQSLAATWASPVALTTASTVGYHDFIALGGSSAVAAYDVSGYPSGPDSLFTRRTTDSGTTWESPVPLASDAYYPAVGGLGADVDAVWVTASDQIKYAHSGDGGASFGSPIALSSTGADIWLPRVARGPGGLVAVVWKVFSSGTVKVRVSSDGGTSFGSAKIVTTVDYGNPQVAVGDGVVYIAYTTGNGSKFRIRRSFDAGASWTTAERVADNLNDGYGIALTAAGTHAYAAFSTRGSTAKSFRIRYRRTLDSGANWSAVMNLSPAAWTNVCWPILRLQGTVLRALLGRCTNTWEGTFATVWYRQSTNGTSWGTAQRVSPASLINAGAIGVGFAGKILVMYSGTPDEGGVYPYVRVGSP